IWKLCLLHLLLFQSFHFTPSNGLNATQSDVGVILDLQTTVGKIFKTCISMAIQDFYAQKTYKTVIVPHFRDSNSDAVAAASAAINLLKYTQVIAIFGPQRSTEADFVIDICDKVKVPIISPATSPALSPQESPYFVRSAWSSASQSKAIAAIVNKFGWREIVLIYEDSNFGSGLVPFLTKDFLESNALVSNMTAISPSAGNDRVLEQLRELNKTQTRVFVVHMLPPLASRFFKKANEAGMMEEGYVWIISDVLTDLLDSVDSETIEAMQGVVGVKAYYPRSDKLRNFTARWRERFREEYPSIDGAELNVFGLWAYDSISALAEGVERVGVASPNFKSRGNLTDLEAIGASNTGPSLVGFIRNFTSKGLSGDFIISNGELQPSAFEIMNVIDRGGNRVGFWTQKYGFSMKPKGNDPNQNLGAIVWPGQTSEVPKGWQVSANANRLRVAVPIKSRTTELVKVEINSKTKLVNATGFCIDVFEEVMRWMQYPIQFDYIPYNNSVGKSNTAYHYDDLIQQLFLKNYDAVVADLTISANRSIYVDFTIPYIDFGVSTAVLIKDNKNGWIFLKPLTMGLWLSIAAFFLFTGFVVWTLERRVNEEFQGPPLQQVGMIFWFSFSTLVFAHKEKVMSNLSRFVVIVWLFAVLVLTSSYTASLTSMLTVQQLDATDIHDLTKKGEYVGYKQGHFIRGFLDSTKSDNSKFRNYSSFEEYDEALTKGSEKGGVGAVVDNTPSIKIFLSKYCHKYTMIGSAYRKSGFGFAFQKGSPLAPDVSRAILQLKESREMEQISRKWFGEEDCGSRINGTSVNSKGLNLDHFKGLFIISAVSSLSALLISSFIFFYSNRINVLSLNPHAWINRKFSELAEAFGRERVEKSSSSSSKESTSVSEAINQYRPPALDSNGKNYAMWKSRMKMYIKSIDERAWLVVMEAWTPPRMEGPDGNFIFTPEIQWTNDDRIISNFNSRALNAIFVSEHCECSTSVRQTKLRMLTSKFEMLRMMEDETITLYTERLCEISNESTALGCPISNENMVSKLLRTLPERFNMKISAIEEAHNVSNMSLSEVVSILLTFEMNLENQKFNNSSKGIALQSTMMVPNVQDDVENTLEINEDENLRVVLLTKKFNSLVRSMKKGSPNFKPRRLFDSSSSTSSGSSKSSKSTDDSRKDIDSVQCRGYTGFGHYVNECPTVHRKQSRNYSAVVLSDESEDEEAEKQTVLFVKVNEDIDEMINALTNIDEVDFDYDLSLDNETTDVSSNVMANVTQEITNISPNTTNWYEMTLLDEFRNTAEVSQIEEEQFDINHKEALRHLHNVVDEIHLTRSDAEMNKLKKEVDDASKNFDSLIREHQP
ncbi:hypothetical protein C2S52_003818, partial [Perilla frutescens var. hirtella]